MSCHSGQVVNWSDIKKLEDGSMVQVMGNVQGGMGKREGKAPMGFGRGIWDRELGGRAIRADRQRGDHGLSTGMRWARRSTCWWE